VQGESLRRSSIRSVGGSVVIVAQQFSVSIEGTKQGRFKSEGKSRDEKRSSIAGVKFLLETVSPRDLATGQASGKRQHKPLQFTKEWGAASPQLYQALVTNEVLKQVVFQFVKTNENGEQIVFHTITLTSASVSNLRSYFDLTDASGDTFDGRALEDVTLVYQKIVIENAEGKTTASDDWKVV
jgi:type VI secretion system secreted protein Hcp